MVGDPIQHLQVSSFSLLLRKLGETMGLCYLPTQQVDLDDFVCLIDVCVDELPPVLDFPLQLIEVAYWQILIVHD